MECKCQALIGEKNVHNGDSTPHELAYYKLNKLAVITQTPQDIRGKTRMAKKSMTLSAVATASAAAAAAPESLSQEDLVFLDEQEADDLSYWELINPSDADSDTESLHTLDNGFVSLYALSASSTPESPNSDPEMHSQEALQDQDLVDDVNSCVDHVTCYNGGGDECCYHQREARPIMFPVVDYGLDDEEEKEDEDEDEEDGYGIDDEFVTWQVSAKLGRQRRRKLGKRGFARKGTSKWNPYAGKHGLGIKA